MFYLGIDLSKALLDCYLLFDENSSKGKTKTFTNTEAGLVNLLIWLSKQHIQCEQLHAVVEATSVYHELAATFLYEAGASVSVTHPAHLKYFGKGLSVRTKTDRVDSQLLARYGDMVKPTFWHPVSLEARVLQDLLTRRGAIMQDLQREKNRQEKTKTRNTSESIIQSLQESLDFLSNQLDKIQNQIDDHIDRHPHLKNDLDLLRAIPAIGTQTSVQMLAILRVNHFNTAEQLAAYLGLAPVERQSGTSIQGRAKLSKAGPPSIRAVLYMAAIVATRHNPHVSALYERLLACGKSKMSALGAAMRKLVHLCFGVLKTQQS